MDLLAAVAARLATPIAMFNIHDKVEYSLLIPVLRQT